MKSEPGTHLRNLFSGRLQTLDDVKVSLAFEKSVDFWGARETANAGLMNDTQFQRPARVASGYASSLSDLMVEHEDVELHSDDGSEQ